MRRHLPRGNISFRFPRPREDNKDEKRPDVKLTKTTATAADIKAPVPTSQNHKPEPDITSKSQTVTPPQKSTELPKTPTSKTSDSISLERKCSHNTHLHPVQNSHTSDTIQMTTKPMGLGRLGTVFTPWQMYGETLDLREALRVGTLFRDLVRTPPLYKKPSR